MDLPVLALVLLAALGHAVWNAWLKDRSADMVGFAALSVGWLVAGAVGAAFVGFPAWDAWPYLIATVIIHTLYAVFLIKAYQVADFSLAYPLARGSGPLFVTLAAPWFLGEGLEGPGLFAVTLLIVGILMIGVFQGRGTLGGRSAVFYSLLTGVLIGAYTLVDAAGARIGENPHAYAAWLFILTSLALIAWTVHRIGPEALPQIRARVAAGAAAGVISVATYWIVLWAMTVAPAALVAATRETSILFAALIGWGFMGEKITPMRWAGIVLVLLGLVMAKV